MDSLQHRIEHTEKESFDLKLQNFYLTTKLSQVTSPGSESTELTLKTLLDEQQRETQHLLDEQRRLRGVAEESQGQLRRALAENAAMRRATPTMPPNEPLFDEEQKVFGQPHDCATIEAVRAAHQEALGMVGAELRACQESLDAEKARNAALEDQVASLEHETQSKSDEIVQLRAQVRDAIDASAGHSNELSRARMEHTSSQREIDARGAETTRLREELEALRSQLIAKAEALEVQKRSIDTIRKSAEEVASFEAEEISRLETENRLLREHVERPNRPAVDEFTSASLAAGTEQLTSGGGPDVVRELSERCDWLQQQNSQLGSTLALVAQCQTDTANALLQQRLPEPDAVPQSEPALVRTHSVLASSPGPAQELHQLQQLLGRASPAAGPGSNGATAAAPAQQPLLVSHPAMATKPGGTEKELHQLHSLLSQTYRVGTSAQDPAVDECIRLSLKLADDILSETTNGTTTNGESLPHTAADTVSAVPVHRAGDEARLLDSLFSLYSSSAAFKPPGG